MKKNYFTLFVLTFSCFFSFSQATPEITYLKINGGNKIYKSYYEKIDIEAASLNDYISILMRVRVKKHTVKSNGNDEGAWISINFDKYTSSSDNSKFKAGNYNSELKYTEYYGPVSSTHPDSYLDSQVGEFELKEGKEWNYYYDGYGTGYKNVEILFKPKRYGTFTIYYRAAMNANNQMKRDPYSQYSSNFYKDAFGYQAYRLDLNIIEPKKPDLEVISYSLDKYEFESGEQIRVSCVVKNTGDASCGSSRVGYYLSTNKTWNDNYDTLLDYNYVKGLSVGEISSESENFNLDSGLTEGTYYILFVADYEDAVTNEESENNNVEYKQITVRKKKPDLIVQNPSATPSSINSGEDITLSCTIKNQGDAKANFGWFDRDGLYYYLSTNTTFDSNDIKLGSSNIDDLESGTTVSINNKSFEIPQETEDGTYYILFYVDKEDDIDEGNNENNNMVYKQISIHKPRPDLIVSSGSLSKTSVNSGESITINSTIKNQGDAVADFTVGNQSGLRYYFSTNPTYSSDDIQIGYSNVNNLSAGSSVDKTKSVSIPKDKEDGSYYILIYIDKSNDVDEGNNENNNVKAIAISYHLPKPDLIVTNFTVNPSTNIAPGDKLGWSFTVTNIGETLSSNNHAIFQLLDSQKNKINSQLNINWDDDEKAYISGIELNDPKTFENSAAKKLIIPDNITENGTYYIRVLVDSDNEVDEIDETNNYSNDFPITISLTGSDQFKLAEWHNLSDTKIANADAGEKVKLYIETQGFSSGNVIAKIYKKNTVGGKLKKELPINITNSKGFVEWETIWFNDVSSRSSDTNVSQKVSSKERKIEFYFKIYKDDELLGSSDILSVGITNTSPGILKIEEVNSSITIEGLQPLILVHGWQSSPMSSDYGGDIWDNFIKYFNSDKLGAQELREKFKIYKVIYVSNLVSVDTLGERLRDALDKKGFNKITLMAHSMGGLVARVFMNSNRINGPFANQKGGERVDKLITLGTPHHGSPMANGDARGNADIGALSAFDELFNNGPKYSEHNRSDLRWDNYANKLFDYIKYSDEKNDFLFNMNLDITFDKKIIAYYGKINSINIVQTPNDSKVAYPIGSDYMHRHFEFYSDGIVPFESAMFDEHTLMRIPRYFKDYNHTQLAKGNKIYNLDIDLFKFIKHDLLETNEALLTVLPVDSWNFEDVVINEKTEKTFTINNEGNIKMTINDITLSGLNSNEFHIINPINLTFDLQPDKSKDIVVEFNPTSEGLKTATLNISNDELNSLSTKSIELRGNAVLSPSKILEVNPDANLNFNNTKVNETRSDLIYLNNSGTISLTGTISITGTDANMFTLKSPSSFTLDKGMSDQIIVQFNPLTEGDKSAILLITNDSDNMPSKEISLNGYGTVDSSIIIVVSPDGLNDFGEVSIDNYIDLDLQITNSGNSPLIILNFGFSNSSLNNNQFSLIFNEEPASEMASGESINFIVRFSPTSIGTKSATIEIGNNSDNASPMFIEFTGIGIDNDLDDDGILNDDDNCPNTANPQQEDIDSDGIGDVCDDDIDGDGILNADDNCPNTANPQQEDIDSDGKGDICDDDIDGDGVVNSQDTCPNTPQGVTVDVFGCEVFNLPANNYKVKVTSASCIGSANGSISTKITDINYIYTVSVTGQDAFTLDPSVTDTKIFEGLPRGSYTVCFTIDGKENYEQCFEVSILEPEPITAVSSFNPDNNILSLELSGSIQYDISINGEIQQFKGLKFSTTLKKGLNQIRVGSSLACQSPYIEEIFISDEVLYYPNPTNDILNLYISDTKNDMSLYVRNLGGILVMFKNYKANTNIHKTIDLSNLPQGSYLISLEGKTISKTFKIIKK